VNREKYPRCNEAGTGNSIGNTNFYYYYYYYYYFIALGTQFSRAKKLMQIVKLYECVSRLVEKLGQQAPERVQKQTELER